MTAVLTDLVKVKMKEERFSLRKAGEKAGVAHTTIDRVKRGDPVDLKSVEKICERIGVPFPNVLGIKSEDVAYKGHKASLIALHHGWLKCYQSWQRKSQRINQPNHLSRDHWVYILQDADV